MVDLHMHVLWGLDDGAKDAQEALGMLRLAASQGVQRIAATVHAYPGIRPFDGAAYAQRLEEARTLCQQNGLEITLMPGAEIAATYQLASALQRQAVPTLGNSDYALVELWHDIDWEKTYRIADSVLKAGCIPVLAHVERYSCFAWETKRALRFRRETGALLQMNASAVLYKTGPIEQRFIKRMLMEQGIDVVASDAHNMGHRAPNLGQAYPQLVQLAGEAYAQQLTSFEVMDA